MTLASTISSAISGDPVVVKYEIVTDVGDNDYIQKTIEYFNNLGYNVNDIFKSYRNMPELCII